MRLRLASNIFKLSCQPSAREASINRDMVIQKYRRNTTMYVLCSLCVTDINCRECLAQYWREERGVLTETHLHQHLNHAVTHPMQRDLSFVR